MRNLLKLALIAVVLFIGKLSFGQYLPPSYEPLLSEIVTNFETIRGTTSLNDGPNSLRLLGEDKIILRMKHKGSVKTLTFETKKDEEGNAYWMSSNQLTTDMVEKYEKELTDVLNQMLDISRKKAKI